MRNYLSGIKAKIRFYSNVLKFNFPNLLRLSVKMSPAAENCLDEFRKNGFVKFNHAFPELADYIDKNYFIKYEKNEIDPELFRTKMLIDLNKTDGDKYKAPGLVTSLYVSYKDPMFELLLCDKDLCSLLYNYFRRQPFYRNSLQLTKDQFSESIENRISSRYHLDGGFHQLTMIMYINDTTENDSHTKYATGSHKKYRFKAVMDRSSISDKWVEENFPINKIFGKKGEVFLFDAGNGFHKISEQPNSTRKLFFINITCGSHIQPSSVDKFGDIPYLSKQYSYIQNMFKKVCL